MSVATLLVCECACAAVCEFVDTPSATPEVDTTRPGLYNFRLCFDTDTVASVEMSVPGCVCLSGYDKVCECVSVWLCKH